MLEKQATQVPTNVPVKLIRIYPGKTGNLYMPGIYKPGELPKAAYNTYYVTVLEAEEAIIVKEDKPRAMSENNIKNGSFEVEELVKRDTNAVGVTEEISINKPQPKNMKQKIAKPVKLAALKINSAEKPALVALNGVAKSTANKILELREQSGFIDYADLNARVPLPFGKDWTAFDISFD